jgi:hypothetical protein
MNMTERLVNIYDNCSNFKEINKLSLYNDENLIIKKNWDEIVALYQFECNRKCGKSVKIFYADSSVSIKCMCIQYRENNEPYCKLKKVKCPHHRRVY